MFNYDRTHKVGNVPPRRRILGELVDDPGQYMIRFLDASLNEIAAPVPTTVDQTRRGRVDAPITACPSAGGGVQIVDAVAEWQFGPAWTTGGASENDGPELIKVDC